MTRVPWPLVPNPKPAAKPKRRGRKDPVTPELYEHLRERDRGCVGPRVGMLGACLPYTFEVDHIDNAGRGKRGPSTPLNTVLLCREHHEDKTYNARRWRPVLREYVRLAESGMSASDAGYQARTTVRAA